MRRRTQFAASLVAISASGCAPAPAVVPRVARVSDRPLDPSPPSRPEKLVEEFPSQMRLKSYEDCSAPGARCGTGDSNHAPFEATRAEVHYVRELPDGTARVRFATPQDPRVDLEWTARAIAGSADVACKITKRGYDEWQCDAAIDPIALARDGHILVEPSAFAARESRLPLCQRRGVYCNPPPPSATVPTSAPPTPVSARIVKTQVQGGDTFLTIGAGNDRGVRRDWSCEILRADTQLPLSGGGCTIIRVDKTTTAAKAQITIDQAHLHTRVRLAPKP